jgi:hypothetical protein
LYKKIDPLIGIHFNRTFDRQANLPKLGMLVGTGLLGYSTYFGFTVPTRVVLTALPIVIDWIRIARDPVNEHHCLDFFNWVIGYRKAKSFIEIHKK